MSEETVASEAVTPCPCCGSYTATSLALAQPPALLAVCDVLVVKALEKVGKMLARNGGNRHRVKVATTTPWYLIHTAVQPTARDIDKGLHGAWDVIPAMLANHGCCDVTALQVERMVDSYTRDLLITGTAHKLSELRYRFERFLGVPLPDLDPYPRPSPADLAPSVRAG